jgi:hypothetical protein
VKERRNFRSVFFVSGMIYLKDFFRRSVVVCLLYPLTSTLGKKYKIFRNLGEDYIGCPTRYQNLHFFNNSNTNEDIATEFQQGGSILSGRKWWPLPSHVMMSLQYPH